MEKTTEQLAQLKKLYQDYQEALESVYKEAQPLAGAFGIPGGPQSHPCSLQFYEAVGQWSETFLLGQPETAQIMEATDFILVAASKHRNEVVYWFFLVTQAHAKCLINKLQQEQCAVILQDYRNQYPPKEWLPINKEIEQLLRKKSGQEKTFGKRNVYQLIRKKWKD